MRWHERADRKRPEARRERQARPPRVATFTATNTRATRAPQPPSDELYGAAVAILRGALPTRAPDARRAGWRRSVEPILLVVAVAAPLLLGGVMAAGRRWGWVYYPLAAHALVWCAPAITRRYELD